MQADIRRIAPTKGDILDLMLSIWGFQVNLYVKWDLDIFHYLIQKYFRCLLLVGEPIAINRAQILTPSCYWEFHRKTQ